VEKGDFDLRLLLYILTKKILQQKNNSNRKEFHFVEEAQTEGKDGLGKPDHLWEGLRISKVGPINNTVGLPFTEENIPVSQTQQCLVCVYFNNRAAQDPIRLPTSNKIPQY